MNPIFTKSFEICSFDVDISQKAKLSTLFGFFQEVASQHAELLNVGYDQLEKNHQVFWALSRIKIHINKYPKWKDTITYKTWPKGNNRIFAQRDFQVFDANNNLLISGTSDWIIISHKNRALVNPATIIQDVPVLPNEHALTSNNCKVKAVNAANCQTKIRLARFNDLDMNQHVNSIKYTDWMLDCLPDEVLMNNDIEEITINY